jgi:hypothetical protein
MATNWKALGLTDLCSTVGYNKNNLSRDKKALLNEIQRFLVDHESKGYRIPPFQTADPIEARRCALNFLYEDVPPRGERFWKASTDGAPLWPEDSSL